MKDYKELYKRLEDLNKPWWQPKEYPVNLWDKCPICFAIIITLWIILAIAPVFNYI